MKPECKSKSPNSKFQIQDRGGPVAASAYSADLNFGIFFVYFRHVIFLLFLPLHRRLP